MIQHGGTQIKDQFMNAIQGLLNKIMHPLQPLMDLRHLFYLKALLDNKEQSSERLAGIVVQLTGDPLSFFFLGVNRLYEKLTAHPLFRLYFGIQPGIFDRYCDLAADR